MTHSFKKAALILGALTMATPAAIVPMTAQAQTADYDGYCYVKKEDIAGKDAAIGAAAGAIAGGLLGKKGDKTKTAVVAATVGGVAGYVVGKNSKGKIRCSKGKYYVYSKGYYDPAPAGEGFKVVFFEERPANVDLYTRSGGKDYRYKGH